MAIDPSKYTSTVTVEVPAFGKCLYLPKTKTRTEVEDGWYEVELYGSRVRNIKPSFAPSVKKGDFRCLQRQCLSYFLSWEHLRRTVGKDLWSLSARPHLALSTEVWEPVFLRMLHGEFFFVSIDYSSLSAIELETATSGGPSVGMSPEMRHLILLESTRLAFEKEQERRKRRAETEEGFRDSIIERFKAVGAEVENVSLTHDLVVVGWKATFYNGRFETVLHRDNLMVKEAGYCASGADYRFNITSLVKTAEEYAAQRLIWLTRT